MVAGKGRTWFGWSGSARPSGCGGKEPVTDTHAPPQPRCRGGNRLGPDHPHYRWTPSYERCRQLPADPCRGDRVDREAKRRCVERALAGGDISQQEAIWLGVALSFSDVTGKAIWPSHAAIGAAMGRSVRTSQRHAASLRAKGWVVVEHRFVVEAGRVRGTSNVTRVDPPAELYDQVRAEMTAARRVTNAQRKASKRVQQSNRAPVAPRPSFPEIDLPERTGPTEHGRSMAAAARQRLIGPAVTTGP